MIVLLNYFYNNEVSVAETIEEQNEIFKQLLNDVQNKC